MKSVLNGLLILAASVGILMLASEWQTLSQLQRECDRLSDRYGYLDIKDPNKFSVMRLKTGDPWEFTWRVYRPSVQDMRYRITSGTGSVQSGTNSSSTGLQPSESIVRYRFLPEEDHIDLHRITESGSGRMSIGDSQLTSFLKDNWEELEFLPIENGEHAIDEPLPFLTIRIPDLLLDALLEQQPWHKRLADRPLIEIVIGTGQAFDQLDAEKENP